MPQTLHAGKPTTLDWHHYDCAGCGCAYRFRRGGAGERNAAKSHPCPECGCVPRESAPRDWGRQFVVAVFGGAVAVMGLGIATAGRMTAEGVAYLVACAAVVLVLFHLAIASLDPNSFRARNLRAARRQVSAGRTQVVRAGRVRGGETTQASATGLVLYLSLAAFAVVLALTPVAVAGAKGVRGNPVAPKMVGPDHVVRVALPVTLPPARPTPA